MPHPVQRSDIEAARRALAGMIYATPCAFSETLSRLTGSRCFVKLENLQMTGSFKERGAANLLHALSPEERARGVATASAGNHGLAVAFHCQRLATPAVIVMPEWAPLIKVSAARRNGAEVVLTGANYDEAYAEARRLQREKGLVFAHPFDDPRVIAGQGTIGLELLEQCPDLEAVVVPVGGGGLVAGIAVAVKAMKPAVQVIGVQAAELPAMQRALAAGGPVELPPAATIADGIAVRLVGELTFDITRRLADEVVTVDEEEIANAILLLLEIEKTVVEGAGASTLAALVNKKVALEGKVVALILSGGNIDVNVISRIIERGLVKDGRLVRLCVLLQDRPGALSKLTGLVAATRANILHIVHDRTFAHARIGETEVELTLETSGRDQIECVLGQLRAAGYEVRELRERHAG